MADVNPYTLPDGNIQISFSGGRTSAEFTDFVARQSDWVFDDESFFCQADGGECTG